MSSPREIRKLLVVQSWGMGDLILATPALAELKAHYPDVQVTVWSGTQAGAKALENTGLAAQTVVANAHDRRRFFGLFWRLRRECFDAAVLCTRITPRMGLLLRWITGIPVIAGDRESDSAPRGYTHSIRRESSLHRVIANQRILRSLFPRLAESTSPLTRPAFSIPDAARSAAARWWKDQGLSDATTIGIHPGGGALQPRKRIPMTLLGEIVDGLSKRTPATQAIVFLGPEDQELSDDVQRTLKPHSNARIATGLSIHQTAALIGRTQAFLAGDSGLGHIASAVGTPVLTLAGPTAVDETRPWGARNTYLRTEKKLPCMPCYGTQAFFTCDHVSCMKSLDAHRIVSKLEEMASLSNA